MKNSNFKVLILPAIILFAVCLVSTFLLAYTNKVTEPKIENLAAANAQAARQDLLDDAKSFEPGKVDFNGISNEYYKGLDGNKTVGYVFTTVATGYGGDVKVMTGVDADGAVKKIKILELSETPGLGMNAKKDSFLDQYIGINGAISVVKNKKARTNEIQALTGATITSSAVSGAVNKALKLYDAVMTKGTPETTGSSAADADETARKQLLPQAVSFDPVKQADGMQYEYYTGKNADGSVAGYLFTTEATGYNGVILVTTAVDSKGVITGVKVLAVNDSPDIGTKVQDAAFLNQYIGLSVKVSVTTAAAGTNQVQAVTGATISSSGVTNAVNKALDLYKSVAGGNQ